MSRTTTVRDPFTIMDGRTPTRYAPGHSREPYQFPPLNAWHPVIYYPADKVLAAEGVGGLVEPYPAARADGTDGQDQFDSAGVAVLTGAAAPKPYGRDLEGDWTIPGKALAAESAYDVFVTSSKDLMAAWCQAHAIATALNNGIVSVLGLLPADVEVLLAAERGALTGDSRFASTRHELRWQALNDQLDREERIGLRQARRLRGTPCLIEAATTREVQPGRPELSTAGRPWTETTYTLTRAARRMLDAIIEQYDGPVRCRECGCTDERACPGGCSWAATGLCSACSI